MIEHAKPCAECGALTNRRLYCAPCADVRRIELKRHAVSPDIKYIGTKRGMLKVRMPRLGRRDTQGEGKR